MTPNIPVMAATVMGFALAIAPTSKSAPAPVGSTSAPMMTLISSEQTPTGGCIYSLANSVKLFCENTEEGFCKPHMGGFVTAEYFEGEFCSSLKARGAY